MNTNTLNKCLIILSIISLISFQSCKKTETAPLIGKSNNKNVLVGNWLLAKIKVTVFDQNSIKLSEDSLVSVKGYTDKVSFDEKEFKISNSLVPYEIIKVNNESFIKYTYSRDTFNLKIRKINPDLIPLDDIKLTAKNLRKTQYYYQKIN